MQVSPTQRAFWDSFKSLSDLFKANLIRFELVYIPDTDSTAPEPITALADAPVPSVAVAAALVPGPARGNDNVGADV